MASGPGQMWLYASVCADEYTVSAKYQPISSVQFAYDARTFAYDARDSHSSRTTTTTTSST